MNQLTRDIDGPYCMHDYKIAIMTASSKSIPVWRRRIIEKKVFPNELEIGQEFRKDFCLVCVCPTSFWIAKVNFYEPLG